VHQKKRREHLLEYEREIGHPDAEKRAKRVEEAREKGRKGEEG
jgi:hypothetical protein